MDSPAYRDSLKREIEEICDFLIEFDWLIEAHGARFFTRGYTKLIPQDWLTALLQLSESSLYLLPAMHERVFHDSGVNIPASLSAFLKKCQVFACPETKAENILSCLSLPSTPAHTQAIDPLQRSPFHTALTKVMKPKKRHEVEILADLIYRLAISYGCHSILDLGCGQGYLMQILSFYYKLSVIGVDSSQLQTNGAIKRAQGTQLLLRSMYRKNKSLDASSIDLTPVFMTLVCPIDTKLTIAQLTHIASQVPPVAPTISDSPYPKKYQAYPFRHPEVHPLLSEKGVILVGLHTCGDLAPTTLRLFHESPTVKAMINIGCCYNVMTDGVVPEKGETDPIDTNENSVCSASSSGCSKKEHLTTGYPLSSICKAKKPSLSRAARVLACQSIAKRPAHVKSSSIDPLSANMDLTASPTSGTPIQADEEDEEDETMKMPFQLVHRSQVFRAVLQVIYEEHCHNQANIYSGGFSKENLVDFPTYATHLISRNKLNPNLSKDQMEEIWQKVGVPNYYHLVAFDSLRVCLAPVIEALLMKDRLLFLLEQDTRTGIPCQHLLFPIFDASISPRNMAFLSLKTPEK